MMMANTTITRRKRRRCCVLSTITTTCILMLLSLDKRCSVVEAFAAASNNKKGFGSAPKRKTSNPSSQGFGASTSGSSTTKKKKKKRSAQLWEIETKEASSVTTTTNDPPALDKWGLPPPTLDDIFPPLDPTVVALPGTSTSLATIRQALADYVPMDLSCFDTEGRCGDMQLRLVHQSPPVLVIDHFLSPEECDAIAVVAGLGDTAVKQQPQYVPHKVSSAQFSSTAVTKRTSTSWFCHYASVPTLLAKLEYVLGWKSVTLEEPQIVSYQPGQQFTWHYDAVPPSALANGGQRLATFLVYLNDVTGGATVFRDLTDSSSSSEPLHVQPVTGRALVFFPADAEGIPDERTLHQGTPPVAEEKRIVQVWNHAKAYRAAVPAQNRQADAVAAVQAAAERLGYK